MGLAHTTVDMDTLTGERDRERKGQKDTDT